FKYYYYQLATSTGKPVPGYDYTVHENTQMISNPFKAVNSDHDTNPLPRSGLFKDRVGPLSQPGKGAKSDPDIRLQTFTLKYKGQEVPVSTVLRHETRIINGNVYNNVTVVTP